MKYLNETVKLLKLCDFFNNSYIFFQVYFL